LAQGALVEGYKVAQRSYSLEPDNPVNLAAMAQAMLQLGQLDTAEELLSAGLEKFSENASLQHAYWLNLLITGRLEEAERLVRERMVNAGDAPSPLVMRTFNLQMGLIALARQDYPVAHKFLDESFGKDEESAFDRDEILGMMLASLVSGKLGDQQGADTRLAIAERKIMRARLNGVDDSHIYYTEAALLAMRENNSAALQKLQQAYQLGFRDLWLLRLDWRMDGLREEQQFAELQSRMEKDIEKAKAEIRALNVAAL
jgi:tetratricopeptide (TPR) repeat protein